MSDLAFIDLRDEDRYQEYIEMMEEAHCYSTLEYLAEFIDKWGLDTVLKDIANYYANQSGCLTTGMASSSRISPRI